MKLQLLSDLHLESEAFDPEPAPGAALLVLAGDIDATWEGYRRFVGWPVPVLVVAGNHEFDGRELREAWPRLREFLARCGFTLLQREALLFTAADGTRVRFVGVTRWSDFDLFGAAGRERALRAAGYFQRVMNARRGGLPFDAEAVSTLGLSDRAWLAQALAEPAAGRWDTTVAVTHFAPSLRSADPRYGRQPGTASFCNADDALLPLADLWLHGHLHCRHDYLVTRPGGGATRVACQAHGLAAKGESEGYDALRLLHA